MKKAPLTLCVLQVLLLFAGCKKHDDIGLITPLISTGTWHVSLFAESGTDKTSYFRGYQFTFQPNGKLTASFSGTDKPGYWSEEISPHPNTFHIYFDAQTVTNTPLAGLTGSWKIASKDAAKFGFTDDSTHTNGKLEFTKH